MRECFLLHVSRPRMTWEASGSCSVETCQYAPVKPKPRSVSSNRLLVEQRSLTVWARSFEINVASSAVV